MRWSSRRSNQRVDRLGECLLRSGAISTEQLLEAERVYRPPAPFGRFLVELGFLSPRELWDGVKAQVEETVRSLFAFGAGSVLFWEGEVRPDNVVRLALPTSRLIAEGLSQRDALLRFLAQLEDPAVRLRPVDGAAQRLGGTERSILEALAEDRLFPACVAASGIDPLSGARTVRLLRETKQADDRARGRRARSRLGDAGSAPSRSGCASACARTSRCSRSWRRRSSRSRAPTRCARASRRSRRSRRGGIRCSRGSTSAAACSTPSVSASARCASRAIAAARCASALGELVSYLEFELLNHPRIEDAQGYLEDLDKLRAAL